MRMKWILVGIVVAGAATVIWRFATRAPDQRPEGERRAEALGQVVLDAYGNEWGKRFEATPERLRAALLRGADPTLRDRVDREVGVIDLKFDGTGEDRRSVATTVVVEYASSAARSTATLVLPWDDVPDEIRGELLRNGRTAVFRKWRAAPEQRIGT